MRIVIDIDGTICETKKPGQTYNLLRVNPGAAEKIRQLKDEGHYIILHTSRHMKTTGGDVSKVIEKVGAITERWLKDNGIVYDEIHFGKPYNQVVIDDRAFWYEGWKNFDPKNFDSDSLNIIYLAEHEGAFVNVQSLVQSFGNLSKQAPRIFFVVAEQSSAIERLKQKLGDQVHIITASNQSSQLQAALTAAEHVNNFQQLIVCAAQAPVINFKEAIDSEDNLVGLVATNQNTAQASYFVINDAWGYVQEISNHAVSNAAPATGLCYFTYGRDFVSSARNVLRQGESSPLACYNDLVARGQRIKAVVCK